MKVAAGETMSEKGQLKRSVVDIVSRLISVMKKFGMLHGFWCGSAVKPSEGHRDVDNVDTRHQSWKKLEC